MGSVGEGARPQSLAAQKNQDGERKETLGWTGRSRGAPRLKLWQVGTRGGPWSRGRCAGQGVRGGDAVLRLEVD